MASFFNNGTLDNEDLLMDGDEIQIVSPSTVYDNTHDIVTRIDITTGYIDAIEGPISAIDTLRETINSGDYIGAIEATKTLDSAYGVVQESLHLKPITIANYDLMTLRAHLVTQEGFMGTVGEKIKAFFTWCWEKITALGNMIRGWFSSKSDGVIKYNIEKIRGKRIVQYDVKGAIYSYDGNKPFRSSVQLAGSAAKVVELFKRYSSYIKEVNGFLNELVSDEGKLKEGDDQSAAINTFIANVNKSVADKKTGDNHLGFTFRMAAETKADNLYSKVIFILKGQKTDRSGKSTEPDVPVLVDYKMSVTGNDIETTYKHFLEAQNIAKGYADELDKLGARIKSLSSAIDAKGDTDDGAKLYKSIKVALEVIGDCIKNIGAASINLAAAKKYWCETVVTALGNSTEGEGGQTKPKPKDQEKTEDTPQ